MIELTAWINGFLQELQETFGERVWFVGLQGSYGRGEAREASDIDMVVILDELSHSDIRAYHKMLDALPNRELICGFLSGKDELLHWEPSDLFQFYYDTKPIKGSLDVLLPRIDAAAVDRAIKLGVCNLYHGCVHNMLHEKSEEALRGLYQSASFVIQAICFQQKARYVTGQRELLTMVGTEEQTILQTFLHLKRGGAVEFQTMSATLFHWAKYWVQR